MGRWKGGLDIYAIGEQNSGAFDGAICGVWNTEVIGGSAVDVKDGAPHLHDFRDSVAVHALHSFVCAPPEGMSRDLLQKHRLAPRTRD